MTEKFHNIYRVLSVRLQNWDYGSNGAYFITICTQNREQLFGEIENGKMILNEIGKQAETCFHEIPVHFPFVELGNFVVMPNHVHAIIILNKPAITVGNTGDDTVETRLIASLSLPEQSTTPSPESFFVETYESPKSGGFAGCKNPMIHDNLSRIIRWYKGRTTFESRKIHTDFAWQPRYHDHIIRNATSFEKIQNYIAKNPLNWNEDKFNE